MSLFGKSSAPYTPDYGKPVVYLGGEKTIRPVNRPPDGGFFSAEPGGLSIDQNSGEIDLSNSDTGLRYEITFTDCDKRETCTHLIISGIDYENKIFSLSSSTPEEYTAKAFYNAHPENRSFKGKFNIIPDDTKPTADLIGLEVHPDTGDIDLKATIEKGGLGFRKNAHGEEERFPANGTCKEFRLYYRLEDESKSTLNYTPIRVHFFDTKDDIPPKLLARVENRTKAQRQIIKFFKSVSFLPLLAVLPISVSSDSLLGVLATLLASLSSFLFLMPTGDGSSSSNKPPEHIGTR